MGIRLFYGEYRHISVKVNQIKFFEYRETVKKSLNNAELY